MSVISAQRATVALLLQLPIISTFFHPIDLHRFSKIITLSQTTHKVLDNRNGMDVNLMKIKVCGRKRCSTILETDQNCIIHAFICKPTSYSELHGLDRDNKLLSRYLALLKNFQPVEYAIKPPRNNFQRNRTELPCHDQFLDALIPGPSPFSYFWTRRNTIRLWKFNTVPGYSPSHH